MNYYHIFLKDDVSSNDIGLIAETIVSGSCNLLITDRKQITIGKIFNSAKSFSVCTDNKAIINDIAGSTIVKEIVTIENANYIS